ncbi:immunity repressor [Mycobacterium Phage Nergal]|nr:immunity repressor [Mycobacterium Phage Nergal]
MTDDDSGKSLAAVLGYLVGRPLRLREILEALQMSKSRYYNQIDEGRLISATNLVLAAQNLGINEVELLARFNLVRDEAVLEYADRLEPQNPPRVAAIKEASKATTKKTGRRLSDLKVRGEVSPM